MKRARRLRLESLEDRLALSGVAMLPEPPIALTDLTIRDAVAADLDGDTDHDVLIGALRESNGSKIKAGRSPRGF